MKPKKYILSTKKKNNNKNKKSYGPWKEENENEKAKNGCVSKGLKHKKFPYIFFNQQKQKNGVFIAIKDTFPFPNQSLSKILYLN